MTQIKNPLEGNLQLPFQVLPWPFPIFSLHLSSTKGRIPNRKGTKKKEEERKQTYVFDPEQTHDLALLDIKIEPDLTPPSHRLHSPYFCWQKITDRKNKNKKKKVKKGHLWKEIFKLYLRHKVGLFSLSFEMKQEFKTWVFLPYLLTIITWSFQAWKMKTASSHMKSVAVGSDGGFLYFPWKYFKELSLFFSSAALNNSINGETTFCFATWRSDGSDHGRKESLFYGRSSETIKEKKRQEKD